MKKNLERRKTPFKIKVVLQIFTLLVFGLSYGQDISISGTVSDKSGLGIPGVNVVVKGTTNGVVTDFDGNYSISAQNGAVLVFSYIGYTTKEISVDGQSVLDVILAEDVTSLDEVVIVGYGAVEKKSLTGSVAAVDESDFIQGFNVTASQAIQGKVAGLNIQEGSGAPGGSARITIRGNTSIAANTQPLFIVDGVPIGSGGSSGASAGGVNSVNTVNPFDYLNPNDIKSISVLKGPSAIAIYGNRGSNGVILVTTNSGTAQRGYVNFGMTTTVTTPGKRIDVFTADEYRAQAQELGLTFTDFGASTDWQDEIVSTAFTTQYNLSAGGGNEKSTYFGSMSWTNEEGTVLGSENKRLTGRVRLTQKAFNDRLNVDLNLNFSSISTDFSPVQVNGGGSATPPIFGMALKYNPTAPVYNEDGSFFEVGLPNREFWNPVAFALQQTDNLKRSTFVSGIDIGYDLVPEKLRVNGKFNYFRENALRTILYPPDTQRGLDAGGGLALKRDTNNSNYLGEATLSYTDTFGGNHNIDTVAGYSYQDFYFDGTEVRQTDLLSDAIGVNIIGLGDPNSLTANVFESPTNRIKSFFGRVNYDFSKKYFLTAVFRRDGSSRFSRGEPWGNFPSFAAAWRISEEGALANSNTLNELKLRAEWGVVGSNNIPGLETANTLELSYDGQNYVATPNRIGNSNLTWETTTTTNVGMDFGLFNNRFSGSVDYYKKVTEDLFLIATVPAPTIDGNLLINGGEMENSGLEVSLSGLWVAAQEPGDFNLSTDFVLAYNKNKVTSLSGNGFDTEFISYGSFFGPSFVGDNGFRIEEGEALHSFYGPEFAGINQDGRETYFTEDGSITDNVNEAEEKYLGNAIPDVTYSLTTSMNYGRFDLSAQLRGAAGAQIVNNTLMEWGQPTFLSSGNNIVKQGILAENAQLTTVHEFSSRFVSDADFLRLENLTVGYNFDVDKWDGINKLRLYFSGRNLFTLTGYDGGDPESFSDSRNDANVSAIYGVDFLNYPRPRIYSIGLNVNF